MKLKGSTYVVHGSYRLVSLNSMLLKGSDLLTPLLSVMFSYIKEMFLQIPIRPEDRRALQFPCRDSPELQMSIMLRSPVAIFGAAHSSAHSQLIKNLNAPEEAAKFPRCASAVKKALRGRLHERYGGRSYRGVERNDRGAQAYGISYPELDVQ